jgi:hypothetical protein
MSRLFTVSREAEVADLPIGLRFQKSFHGSARFVSMNTTASSTIRSGKYMPS